MEQPFPLAKIKFLDKDYSVESETYTLSEEFDKQLEVEVARGEPGSHGRLAAKGGRFGVERRRFLAVSRPRA